jgi:hypothetical protein
MGEPDDMGLKTFRDNGCIAHGREAPIQDKPSAAPFKPLKLREISCALPNAPPTPFVL